jgi:hypothetical protein
MGENFRQWADVYFDSQMNEVVERKAAHEDCMKSANMGKLTPQSFFKKLQAWAEFNGFGFSPMHVDGWKEAGTGKKYGYIKRNIPHPSRPGKYTTMEYVYIEQKNHEPAERFEFEKEPF